MVDFIKKLRSEYHARRRKELQRQQELMQMVNNSYESLRVVGRGTVRIDPHEVACSEEFRNAKELAKQIVNAQ
ncbi:MAG: hypothetical protein Q4A16_03335 [Lautropia sp.]|nr:hypothetical protein [Lautropia sp.]